jgi:uncharacterized protein YegP (UPF0339 family)
MNTAANPDILSLTTKTSHNLRASPVADVTQRRKPNFDRRKAKDGQDYFVLKAGNGEIIGKSEMYKSAAGMENGIKSVMKNAKGATKDLTA